MGVQTKEIVSEFIGTYLLVLTVGCNVIGGSGTWAALSIASVLMVSVYSLASVSGAAFNPAVVLAVALTKGFEAKHAIFMVTQLVAGILAGLSYLWLHGSAFNLAPGANFSGMQAGVVEILYTFMLCFVVLRTAVKDGSDNEYFGLAIGWVIVAGGYAGGWISGGAFNPAVAFGIDVASAGQGVYWCLMYTVYEFIGAALAFGAHKVLGDKDYSQGQRLISEFLGTFFLVLTVGLNVLGQSPAPALSIGASLMCMIYALGDVSGAHFNPAVTTALFLAGKMKKTQGDVAPYFAVQIAGAIAAGIVYSSITGQSVPLGPGAGHSWTAAAFAEIIYTFVLCFVVLNVAALTGDKHLKEGGKSKEFFGLAIGFCIVAGGYAIGSVSGGSLNPAVSFGLDTSHAMKGGSWLNCLPYSAFELVGAGLAAGAFGLCRDEGKEGGLLPSNKKGYGAI